MMYILRLLIMLVHFRPLVITRLVLLAVRVRLSALNDK